MYWSHGEVYIHESNGVFLLAVGELEIFYNKAVGMHECERLYE